jgi:hypothetical protein
MFATWRDGITWVIPGYTVKDYKEAVAEDGGKKRNAAMPTFFEDWSGPRIANHVSRGNLQMLPGMMTVVSKQTYLFVTGPLDLIPNVDFIKHALELVCFQCTASGQLKQSWPPD